MDKLFGQRQAAEYFPYQMLPLSKKEREQLPPPPRGCHRPDHRFQFSYDQAAADRDADYDGYSVLVATTRQSIALRTSHYGPNAATSLFR